MTGNFKSSSPSKNWLGNDSIPDASFYSIFISAPIYFSIFFSLSGLIQRIFKTLYDLYVVSKEGFKSWMVNKEPLEQEDKFIALSYALVTWLEETGSESELEE